MRPEVLSGKGDAETTASDVYSVPFTRGDEAWIV
jgi:hypothetical protein